MNLPLLSSLVVIALLCLPIIAHSHGGGLNSEGCHTNRKTGDYHCHGAKRSSSSSSSSSSNNSLYDYSSQPTYKPREIPIKVERNVNAITQTTQNVEALKNVGIVGIEDGDTFTCVMDSNQIKIRLYGIDAPEGEQAYGDKSRDMLEQLLSGRNVSVDIIEEDKYVRQVAMVYADGMSVNEALVKNGAAWVFPKYCKKSVCSQWDRYQQQAKSSQKLLWNDTQPMAPWDYRHRTTGNTSKLEANDVQQGKRSDECSVEQILKMKEIGLSDIQIKSACE